MPAYVPPHKLRQAAGDAAAAGTGTTEDTQPLNNTSPTTTQFGTRGGGRAGFNGRYGRGGGRGWSSRPTPVDSGELNHYRDIVHYFWPDKEDFTSDGQSTTFHASASQEDRLAYVMLFTNANPRWRSDQIVFAKSHLRLLPDYQTQTAGKEEYFPQPKKRSFSDRRGSELSQAQDDIPTTASGVEEGLGVTDETEALETQDSISGSQENCVSRQEGEATSAPAHHTPGANAESTSESPHSTKAKGSPRELVNTPPLDYVPSQHAPIAVFGQAGYGEFRFAGWYSVARVSILAPHSPDLVRMLQQKWERRDRWGNVVTKKRDASGWKTSLTHQWAVVKFEKLIPEIAPAAPTIEKLPPQARASDSEKGGKGVSELLNELRLKDQVDGKAAVAEEEGHKVVEQGESTLSLLSASEAGPREDIPPSAE
ncbi:hypothetical protein PG993_014317 [Apiospora rasikravindrae]|uniref:Uncharacterized protein n=1 Tax=Apiospora rasikravindrae TaxID=990691 RepID=A0ABR1RPF0_9PEZI